MSIAAQIFVSGRAESRIPVTVDGTLRGDVGDPLDVEVEDISSSGFRARVPVALDVGEVISIGIAGLGTRPARVVRSDGRSVGCQFFARLPGDFDARIAGAASQVVVPVQTPAYRTPAPATVAVGDDRLPMPVRVATIVGLSSLGWAAIYALIALI
ncbi:PilZ domain-containing protein [Sphingomonas floccifaciens]|uniref:PilZ domain-containing protein n=1 Tax=Sphingomonas floccifaciens TaxID=1844115 RepID=A0ABW4N911_9SPHN